MKRIICLLLKTLAFATDSIPECTLPADGRTVRFVFMKIAHLPRVNTITDDQMHLLEKRFGVKAREGWLD